jgi:hypothetical protein
MALSLATPIDMSRKALDMEHLSLSRLSEGNLAFFHSGSIRKHRGISAKEGLASMLNGLEPILVF